MSKLDLSERIVKNRLKQIGQSFRTHRKRSRSAVFQCECGNKKVIVCDGVKNGHTTSCGCFQRELNVARSTTHGHKSRMTPSSEYLSWTNLKKRCLDSSNTAYPDYGGRGITVCDRWKNSFQAFLDDMGTKLPGMEIDRINNDGNYEKSNCKWSTRTEQARNKRDNRNMEWNGEVHCLSEWAEITGVSRSALENRVNRGWSVEKALTTPVRQQKVRKK